MNSSFKNQGEAKPLAQQIKTSSQGPPANQSQISYQEKQRKLIQELGGIHGDADEYEFSNRGDDSPIPLAKLGGSANTSIQGNTSIPGSGGTGGHFASLVIKESQANMIYNANSQQQNLSGSIDNRESLFSLDNQNTSLRASKSSTYQIPNIVMKNGQVGYFRGSEFSVIDQRPEYFTVKMNLQVAQDNSYFHILLSIPSTYRVQDAIMHSLEHFNHKLQNFRLKMQLDYYSLIKATDNGDPDESQPILHPTQNLYETGITNFCLQYKNCEQKALVKKMKNFEDDSIEKPSKASPTITQKIVQAFPLFKKTQKNPITPSEPSYSMEIARKALCCLCCRKSQKQSQQEEDQGAQQELFQMIDKDKEQYKKLNNKKLGSESYEEDYRYSLALLDLNNK